MAPENTLLQRGESLSKICNEKFLGFKLAPREKLYKRIQQSHVGGIEWRMAFFRTQVIKPLFVTRGLFHLG